jgi:hypothetical protein
MTTKQGHRCPGLGAQDPADGRDPVAEAMSLYVQDGPTNPCAYPLNLLLSRRTLVRPMCYCGGVADVQLLEPETPVGDVPVGGDPVGLVGAAADALQGLDRESLTGRELGELLVGLQRQKNRLLAGELGVVRAFERRGTWQVDGAKSAAGWLARKLRAPLPVMRRLTRLARRLPGLPATAQALAGGDISAEHAEALARVAGSPRRAVRDAFDAEVERSYVGYAIDNEFEDFADSLRVWQDWVDQDGAEDQADSDHEARHLHLSETIRGNWVLNGQLDPVVGAEVAEALRRIDRELFEADWADAKAVHGEDTRLEHLARSPAQRRADALGEMARRASTAPKEGKRPRPLFVAHLGADSLKRLCETALGTPITPGQLVPLITQADIERIVYAGESREVLDLGAKTRFFTGALRRAIQLRDRQCVEPGCRIPADQCEVDHDTPNSLGGPTNQFNGKCRCRTSHRHKSRTDGSHPRPRPHPGDDQPPPIDTS